MSVTMPGRLRAAAVGQLGDGRGVDVDADQRDRRRQDVAGRDRVQHRRDHDGEADAGQLGAHRALPLDHVGVDVGQRPVVAHRADEHERLVVRAPCACMTPRVRTPCSTAAAIEPAARIVLIARMWCSWPCSTPRPLGQVDAERRAEQRRLDVVGGERVAGEQHVDEARRRPARTIAGRGAGVHDGRAADPAAPCWPAALTSRICSAIWRTSRACGFSLDTTEFMNSKTLVVARARAGGQHDLARRAAPQTIWSPARTSLTGIV